MLALFTPLLCSITPRCNCWAAAAAAGPSAMGDRSKPVPAAWRGDGGMEREAKMGVWLWLTEEEREKEPKFGE